MIDIGTEEFATGHKYLHRFQGTYRGFNAARNSRDAVCDRSGCGARYRMAAGEQLWASFLVSFYWFAFVEPLLPQ